MVLSITCLCYRAFVRATLKIIFRSADIKGVQRTIDKLNSRIDQDMRGVTPGHPFDELCAECERLLARSRQLRDAHVEAGNLLATRAESISPAEFIALRMAAEETRIDS